MRKQNNIGRKLAFASADIFGGGAFNIVNFLYPGFLALVLGLSPLYASIILLVSKVWDASIDPFIGYISDKTNSRFGKRRFYLIVVGPFVLLSFFMLFFPYYRFISSTALKVIAVIVSYLTFTGVQSLVMIPYYSLSSEIASDYQERASFNSVRLGFSIFASILCVALPGLIVNMFPGDQDLGYIVMSLVFGTLFTVSILITGFFAREEIVTPPTTEKLSFKGITKPLKIRAFRQHLTMHLMVQIAMAVMSAVFFFYTDFFLEADAYRVAVETGTPAPATGLIAAALLFGMQIVALPFYTWMIKKKGKMFTYRFGSYIWIIGGALIFLPIMKDLPRFVFYIVAAFIGFGISAPGLIPHTTLGDVIDVGELEMGERLDGQMGGFANFMVQLGQGIGLGVLMLILYFAKFREKVEIDVDISWQPDSAITAIRYVMLLTPIIFLTVGIIVSFFYKIDAQKQREVREAIAARKVATETVTE